MPTLDWIGKSAVVTHHHQVPFHLLQAQPELSIGDPQSGNLLIQGDNLLALKALLPHYAGKVKCIYIDPPYNTGNEGWVYNDNVTSPEMKAWLGKVVGKEAEDLSRHDKWLCMMYPRLVLLRELLAEDGSLWVSIDDNEVHYLRLMLDEIFGASKFEANIVWQKKYAMANDHKGICPMHDHIIVYRKGNVFDRNLLPRSAENDRQYKFVDEKGIFRVDNYTCNKSADERPNLYYPVMNPNTGDEIWPKKTAVWRYSQIKHQENIANNLVYWGKDGKGKVPAFKRYRNSLKGGGGTVPPTWWPHDFAGHTDEAKKELRVVVEHKIDFITPKPTRLIERVLQIAIKPGDIILDSFAGSGTTGHAVLKANAEDGGQRRIILIEMEPTIAQNITRERLKRVVEGYGSEAGLGGGFQFCRLGEPLFDARGRIRPEVRFEELARHVFFTETQTPLPPDWKVESPLLGVAGETAVYLLYNGILKDRSVRGGNVLTQETLASLPAHSGPKVIYGVGCRLTPDHLKASEITFRQTPYQIKIR